ncbi:MAG TPA: DUF6529 family protein [Caulobacteraceae bacterium]|nr:DUF6529 family protein [Caulobacteraceae bacterium]
MQGVIEALSLGYVSEVKVVLASALAALALYQAALMAVGYGRVRLSFFSAASASRAHRALGDTVVFVAIFVSLLCIGYFGWEAEAADAHAPVAIALLLVLAAKIAIVRWLPRLSFLLPVLGLTLLALFLATWALVAAPYLVPEAQ